MRFLVSLLAGALLFTGCSTESSDEGARRNTNAISESPTKSKPADSSRWAVVGVAQDDKLNVRRQPNAAAKVMARLEPLATGLKVSRRTKGEWRQITVDGRTGWVHGRYLARLGQPVDVTSEVTDLGVEPTRFRLARKVASRQAEAGDGPLIGPVLANREGTTFTLDVLGYADDSVRGERFVVVVAPGEAGFQAEKATATPMCARSVDTSGLCG